jgi:cytidylate kinase
MAVITISRELGSEGDQVATLLAERLGYRWVDKALLTQMAHEAGMDEEAVLALERSIPNRARLTSTDMRSLYSKQPGAWEKKGALDDQTYRRVLRETMEKYATEGNAIIIGRGGQMVLRDWPTALHVHLFAPAEVRTQRIMQRFGIAEPEAARRITTSDEEKRLFIRFMHDNANWKDPKYYHLIINTGVVTPEAATEMIMLGAQER